MNGRSSPALLCLLYYQVLLNLDDVDKLRQGRINEFPKIKIDTLDLVLVDRSCSICAGRQMLRAADGARARTRGRCRTGVGGACCNRCRRPPVERRIHHSWSRQMMN
jgi:hypothetical protein